MDNKLYKDIAGIYDYIGEFLFAGLDTAEDSEEMMRWGTVFLNYARLGVLLEMRSQEQFEDLIEDWKNQGVEIIPKEKMN